MDINYAMNGKADWIHMNAVDYHPELDQIVLSARYSTELWLIDHSTTSQEAASSAGGRYGHGGDLLYRLGNPMAYGQGEPEDKYCLVNTTVCGYLLAFQGTSDITVFNNGTSPAAPPAILLSTIENASRGLGPISLSCQRCL